MNYDMDDYILNSLCYSVKNKNLNEVKTFFKMWGSKSKKIVNTFSLKDGYPIDIAIETGSIEMVELLLSYGAKLRESSLKFAVKIGNGMVKYLDDLS